MSCANGRGEVSSPTAPLRSIFPRAPSAPTSRRRAARATCCLRRSSITSRRTGSTPRRAAPPDDGSSQAPESRALGPGGHQGARDRGLRRDPPHLDVRPRDHRERGFRPPGEGIGEPRPGKGESGGGPRLRGGRGGRGRLGAARSGRHRAAHHAACGALALQSRRALGPAEAAQGTRPAKGGIGARHMKLWVIAVGTRMPGWVDEAFDEYAKRMPRDLRIELIEVRPEPRSGGKSTAQLLEAEGRRIERAVPRGTSRVALDESGRELSTAGFAGWLAAARQDGRDAALDRKSTRLNSSHITISYAVFCLKKK